MKGSIKESLHAVAFAFKDVPFAPFRPGQPLGDSNYSKDDCAICHCKWHNR